MGIRNEFRELFKVSDRKRRQLYILEVQGEPVTHSFNENE
jgi:hypothetical protein